jgi:hypothetical protein
LAAVVRNRLDHDSAKDAFGVHALGGVVGLVLAGTLATSSGGGAGARGALLAGGRQLAVQLLCCVVAAAYAGLMTWVVLKVVDATFGLYVARAGKATVPEPRPQLVETPGRAAAQPQRLHEPDVTPSAGMAVTFDAESSHMPVRMLD